MKAFCILHLRTNNRKSFLYCQTLFISRYCQARASEHTPYFVFKNPSEKAGTTLAE